ncbi:MAG: hypothetical protein A2X12_02765 [Bacteroidetes bacterium GWE2_29_8]|nr:MAG: hypothetical protein A2X12_02765 [Bacteroidetes bacterium GWE2_29_8]OFY20096.1 MAG: hypothetical protein A2X02_06960 [Bacteroidetes bacterium GWF2_29_10]
MINNESIIESKAIYEFYKNMQKENVMLLYQGDVNQSLLNAILSITEGKLDTNENGSAKKRVLNIMVECVQNIYKHYEHLEQNIKNDYSSILMLALNEDKYIISTGNVIFNDKVELIKNKLDNVNSLDKEGLKSLYMEIMKNGKISEKGGAGLGLIDIARKSGEKIEYHFSKISETYSYYILVIKIKKK